MAKDGPFSTSYKRQEFMKEHFSVVEPKEYILGEKEGKTFQYAPILESLLQVLNNKNIQRKASDMILILQEPHSTYHFSWMHLPEE